MELFKCTRKIRQTWYCRSYNMICGTLCIVKIIDQFFYKTFIQESDTNSPTVNISCHGESLIGCANHWPVFMLQLCHSFRSRVQWIWRSTQYRHNQGTWTWQYQWNRIIWKCWQPGLGFVGLCHTTSGELMIRSHDVSKCYRIFIVSSPLIVSLSWPICGSLINLKGFVFTWVPTYCLDMSGSPEIYIAHLL